MEFLAALWLPIVLAAVFIFVVSSVVHMALPIHKGDIGKMADEEAVLSQLRHSKVVPGEYMFPCAGSMKEMSTPEMLAKLKQGPVGFLTVLPQGGLSIGRSLLQWFVFTLVVSLCVAYLADLVLVPGAPGGHVFRVTGTAGFLAYSLYPFCNSIWKGVAWSTSWKFAFDGLLYALSTGAAFTWFWPAAAA